MTHQEVFQLVTSIAFEYGITEGSFRGGVSLRDYGFGVEEVYDGSIQTGGFVVSVVSDDNNIDSLRNKLTHDCKRWIDDPESVKNHQRAVDKEFAKLVIPVLSIP